MKIELDFSEIKTQAELHKYLASQLNLPAHYGKNLDALWDCLSEQSGLQLKIKGKSALKKQMPEFAAKLFKLFDDSMDNTC